MNCWNKFFGTDWDRAIESISFGFDNGGFDNIVGSELTIKQVDLRLIYERVSQAEQ